jgi:colicin import membrane protein
MSAQTIELADIGPLERLSIPLKPGFNVLTGRNDAGKSCTIEAVAQLAGGAGRITCRDGAVKGSIEGLGVRITAGRSTRRSGELEALSLESSLPIADMVDPKIKDPLAADGKRIKALLAITGAKADPALFYGLAGGKEAFDKLATVESLQADDLVDLAARVKRCFERVARVEEDGANNSDGKAAADRDAGAGLDMSIETDAAKLQSALESAVELKTTLEEQARAAQKAKANALAAKSQLDKIAAQAQDEAAVLVRLNDAKLAEVRTQNILNAATEAKRQAEDALREATAEVERAFKDRRAADLAIEHAIQSVESLETNKALAAGWQAQIDEAADAYEPSPGDLKQADEAVHRSRQAIERAAVVRAASERIAKATKHQKDAAAARKQAERLREAARQTDDVLSDAVNSRHLKVKAGRLVTIKDDGREAYYADRSQGTRWTIALDEATDLIRRMGAEGTAIIAAPQEAFESLDVRNRRLIHEHAVKLGVAILTAEAIGEEVAVRHYDPDNDWKANGGKVGSS